MPSIAQMKRDLRVGTVLKTVLNSIKPMKNGEIRTITRQQTNAIAIMTPEGKESWLWWPKANQIEYDGRYVSVYQNAIHQNPVFVYEIVLRG